ncbi:MAG: hypothetical protein ABWW69_02035 [Pyrodictiaceae archaeon]
MAEAPSKVLTMTIRTRASLETVSIRLEGLLEHLARQRIFTISKVGENVYLVEVSIKAFLRTIKERLILAKSTMLTEKGVRMISFNDVDNKFMLTLSLSKEREGYTSITISCSSLSRLKKLCHQFADIIADMASTIELAAVSETIEIARETTIKAEATAVREASTSISTKEAVAGREEGIALIRVTDKYKDLIGSEALATLILKGNMIHRSMLLPNTSKEAVLKQLARISRDQGRIVIATITSPKTDTILAIAMDPSGEATISYTSAEAEKFITSLEELDKIFRELLSKGARLTVYSH